jgi:hypothetical protein
MWHLHDCMHKLAVQTISIWIRGKSWRYLTFLSLRLALRLEFLCCALGDWKFARAIEDTSKSGQMSRISSSLCGIECNVVDIFQTKSLLLHARSACGITTRRTCGTSTAVCPHSRSDPDVHTSTRSTYRMVYVNSKQVDICLGLESPPVAGWSASNAPRTSLLGE